MKIGCLLLQQEKRTRMTTNSNESLYIAKCRCLLRVLQKFSIIARDSPCELQFLREPNLLLSVYGRKIFLILIHKCTSLIKHIAKHGLKKMEIMYIKNCRLT